ncbi:MATE efflux family protein 4 isoform 3 [Theobroma cacao]|uniref:MATE efflux family protein 4 isoform 3 n=1 Tax=Theobroma cacao TaxID=3641 RepID=A0A061E6I0_THECC|nr:MATE efflux family protein 4 isoform 3 [Theobroma cacao]
MQAKALLTHPSPTPPLQNPNLKLRPSPPLFTKKSTLSTPRFHQSFLRSFSRNFVPQNQSSKLKRYCISLGQELNFESNEALVEEEEEEKEEDEEEVRVEIEAEGLANQSIWNQMKEIVMFTGPASGLWICGPLMSLIDTAVIGQGSSIELAALGPATVVCDYMGYVFMFLSVATSNMVATSLARRDKNEVQHQISILLFIGLICGFLMLFFTRLFGSQAITAFSGTKNAHLVPAGNTYVQIRGLAWPAVLVGWVAQSASLGMKDSWGPAYMMIEALNKKGYNAFSISIPSLNELLAVLTLAAPVFVTMMSKVAFYSLLIYFATSMGTHTVAAHQVMLQTLSMCTVWGEPISQSAQSFMPELICGVNRNLSKARVLLKSLVTIGATLGLVLGIIGTAVPCFFPNIFTPDPKVIQEVSSCFSNL